MKTDSESIKYNELGKFLSKGIEIGVNEVISEARKTDFCSNVHNITPLDQSVKADAGKPKLSLVPSQIIWDIAEVREYGNKKYPDGGKDNWKRVEMGRYIDALYRHFLAFIDNPFSNDTESGIPHYKHMACNMAFICEMMEDCKIPELIEKDMNVSK